MKRIAIITLLAITPLSAMDRNPEPPISDVQREFEAKMKEEITNLQRELTILKVKLAIKKRQEANKKRMEHKKK